MQLSNPLEDRIRTGTCGLSPGQMAKATTLIARFKRAIETQRRMDEAVRASLHRVLGEMVREELARAAQAEGRT
jgi:hypothetical protein